MTPGLPMVLPPAAGIDRGYRSRISIAAGILGIVAILAALYNSPPAAQAETAKKAPVNALEQLRRTLWPERRPVVVVPPLSVPPPKAVKPLAVPSAPKAAPAVDPPRKAKPEKRRKVKVREKAQKAKTRRETTTPAHREEPAKGGRDGSVAGYSCSTVRLAGSAARVETLARGRGYTVSPSIRRQIQACFARS